MPLIRIRFIALLLSATLGLSACTNKVSPLQSTNAELEPILNYYSQLPYDHPDRIETLLTLPQSVKDTVKREFGHLHQTKSGVQLARWLMAPEGQSLIYDINANLTPAEVFKQRRGNCLSFTLLLIKLSEELNINVRINQVDLPDMWGQSENQDLVFYRHVNAIQKTATVTNIFDLAMQDYRQGLPQRLLTAQQGAALLFSNIGVQALQEDKTNKALHYLKLAASLYPNNADMWINLGAIYKSIKQPKMAEKVYLLAFELNDSSSLAASNLDRLYRSIEQPKKALTYAKLADRARQKNPYIRFTNAQSGFAEMRYRYAANEIKRAIQLYSKDPQFFELSSRIKQAQKKYISALKDLEKAHQLSSNNTERGRYAKKVKMVLEHVKQQLLASSELEDKRSLRKLTEEIKRYNN